MALILTLNVLAQTKMTDISETQKISTISRRSCLLSYLQTVSDAPWFKLPDLCLRSLKENLEIKLQKLSTNPNCSQTPVVLRCIFVQGLATTQCPRGLDVLLRHTFLHPLKMNQHLTHCPRRGPPGPRSAVCAVFNGGKLRRKPPAPRPSRVPSLDTSMIAPGRLLSNASV